MWRVGPIKTRGRTLADRMVTFHIPESWEITERVFNQAEFKISGLDRADVLFVADSFENPSAIAADDLRSYLAFPPGNPVDDDEFDEISAAVRMADGRIDWKKITLRRKGHRNDPETGRPYADAIVWRRVCVLPPAHIRMLTVTLSLAEEGIYETRIPPGRCWTHSSIMPPMRRSFQKRVPEPTRPPKRRTSWRTGSTTSRPFACHRGGQLQSMPGEGNLLPSYSYDDPENDLWTFWIQSLILPLRG